MGDTLGYPPSGRMGVPRLSGRMGVPRLSGRMAVPPRQDLMGSPIFGWGYLLGVDWHTNWKYCLPPSLWVVARKSSYMNARGILPTAKQVLTVMGPLVKVGTPGQGQGRYPPHQLEGRYLPPHQLEGRYPLAKVGNSPPTCSQGQVRYPLSPISWKVGTPPPPHRL